MEMKQKRARMQLICLLSEIEGHHELTDWEERFILNLGELIELHPDLQLSPRQLDKLEQIFKERQNG